MIELLLAMPESDRPERSQALAERLVPDVNANARAPLAAEVMRLLENPKLAEIFAPGGLSEVPVLGQVTDRDGTIITVTGRIDRLIVQDDRVLIVDYKSDAVVPNAPERVGEGYRDQLSAYAALLEGDLSRAGH
jgi:ATP-dependent helicase/nuclease subunit A